MLSRLNLFGTTHQIGSIESFLSEDHPATIRINENRKYFGMLDRVVVVSQSPNLFSAPNPERLRQLHEALNDPIPDTERAESLLNARSTRGADDTLTLGEFLAAIPSEPARLNATRR